MTTEHEYEVQLIDDGTLDTVVSVEGTQYRYNWDPSADEETTYEDFVAWAMKDAVEQYEMDLEILADHYREKANVLREIKRLRGLLQAVLDNADEADLDNEVYLDSEIINRIKEVIA